MVLTNVDAIVILLLVGAVANFIGLETGHAAYANPSAAGDWRRSLVFAAAAVAWLPVTLLLLGKTIALIVMRHRRKL